ncbi:conserved hypothetical protein [Vibrio nigripulchritudo SOn1]|uniref:Carboxyvinyl-carboxyphosphonate phosphorylmutase n=1 Tax=Vibrio nigripulchritudo SOn1 TaxID=1238450 RepID=A0AAV2VXE9_9VIBR|nr:isocitrate lyase/phosphoenolpyruvate mutase family protein [Vibrio nigripulchritudo]CCO49027.1 conserved hypothetical protein [Vibrio nigripulchritudo SOn1]
MTGFQEFKNLHEQNSLLHIGNAWDANSAILFQSLGYQAIGTSSAAIAESLGYLDGEEMSFDELFSIVKQIKQSISLPLTVDLEFGYSNELAGVLQNIISLAEIGVAGINLEDSRVDNGVRKIVDADKFGAVVRGIRDGLSKKGINVFLNIRTDAFLMGLDDPLTESVTRARVYEASGADGIFVPRITNDAHIEKIVGSVSIPVNVMGVPGLPVFSRLQELGVKRVSMGSFFYKKMNQYFAHEIDSINESESFDSLFS